MEQYVELDDVEKKYLEKLEQSDMVCGKILGLEDLDNGARNKISELQKKNERILKKLRNQEFTVAVIGQESSGKSTVLNALMNMIALPDDTGRCTFTTTTIRADSRDYAEVFFYSLSEFRENFADKMMEMGYDGDADFDNIDVKSFRNWLEDKKNFLSTGKNSFSDKQVNIADDVSNILNDKATVKEFLKGGSMECDIGTEEFRLFITGRKSFNDINRTAHPYAVKEIIIHSTQLQIEGMANMVLFDVPGFNSTTEMHKEQTYDKLRTADAIIMTKDMQQDPNIVDSELHILRHEEDEEKIPLYEKLFVFGNKHDMAVSDDGRIANRNRDMFMRDIVEKYHLADRAVVGSAKIRLIRQNKLTDEDKDSPGKVESFRRTSELMETLGISDGIEELNEKLRHYYKYDRSRIRKMRAEKIIKEITEYLSQIAENYKVDAESTADPFDQYIKDALNSLDSFADECGKIVEIHNSRIKNGKEFSLDLNNEITSIFPDFKQDDEDYKKAYAEQTKGADVIPDLEDLDRAVRKKLNVRFQHELTKRITALTKGKQNRIRQEVIDKFLDIVGVRESHPQREEFAKDVERLFIKILEEADKDNRGTGRLSDCRFDPLVDRFTGFLIESLVLRAFGSKARKEQVLKEENSKFEILALGVYYGADVNNTNETEKNQQVVLRKIMAHEGISVVNKRSVVSESMLKKFLTDHREEIFQGLSIAVMMALPYAKWARFIASFGGLCKLDSSWVKLVQSGLKHYSKQWEKEDDEGKKKLFIQIVDKVLMECGKTSSSGQNYDGRSLIIKVDATDSLNECLKALQEMPNWELKSQEEIVAVLNQDIYALRDIMSRAAIRAMGLERTFITIIDHNANFIRKEAKSKKEDNRFQQWILDNIRRIRKNEYDRREQELEIRKKKKEISEQLTVFLGEMGSSVG